YDDYQSLEMEADGLAGKKEALVDEIFMHIVPDTSTRLAGLQTGEYDIAYQLSYDNYEQLKNDPNIEQLFIPTGNLMLGYNKVQGLASDFKMREIINTAIDANEIMSGA